MSLEREVLARGAAEVAPELLGAVLVMQTPEGVVRARIVETEAYVGQHDLACHASKGLTARNAVMFGPAGHAYVYLIYGMYHMLNVVTATEGDPQAVLIRACEPPPGSELQLNGPGKLTRALGITRELNGHDLSLPPLVLERGEPPRRIGASPRIGVDYAGEWAQRPLRFFDLDSEHVSRR